jgi:hypothetical protein
LYKGYGDYTGDLSTPPQGGYNEVQYYDALEDLSTPPQGGY